MIAMEEAQRPRRKRTRAQRLADEARGTERRRRRTEQEIHEREKQQKIAAGAIPTKRGWKKEYGESRKLKAAVSATEKAAKALAKAQGRLAAVVSENGNLQVLDRQVEQTYVSSPTVAGGVDIVWRPIDVVEKLRSTGKISKVEHRVALSFRAAFDVTHGSIGGVMDFDRVRGGGGSGRALSEAEMTAGKTLRSIEKIVAPLDVEIMTMIIGYGMAVDECAAQKFGTDPKTNRATTQDRDYTERRLIDALKSVALNWHPPAK